MTGNFAFVMAVVLAGFAVAGQEARAGIITSLYSTGVDANGDPLPGGSVDLHYQVQVDVGPSPPAAFVVINPAGFGWAANTSASAWISADPSGVPGGGTFTYTTTFDLTGFDPTTAQVTADLAADDGAIVRLNGAVVFDDSFTGANTPWASLANFTISSGFQAGINTLTIEVPNGLVEENHGPSGLQLHVLSATADEAAPSAVPEPGGLALFLTGSVVTWGVTALQRRLRPRRNR